MYFPFDVSLEQVPLGMTIDKCVSWGATIGYLTFLLNSGGDDDDGLLTNIVLYTFMGNKVISKTPHMVGGTIALIIFTKAIFADVLVTELVGGFDCFVLLWKEDMNIGVMVILVVEWLDALNLTSAMVDINAFNDDEENGFDLQQDTVDVKDMKGITCNDNESKNNGMNQNNGIGWEQKQKQW